MQLRKFRFTIGMGMVIGVLLSAAVIVTLLSLDRIREAESRLQYLSGQLQAGSEVIHVQRELIQETQIRVRNIAMLNDHAVMLEELKKLQASRARYDESEKTVDRMFSAPSQVLLVEESKALRSKGRAILDAVVEMSLHGQREAAVSMLLMELVPVSEMRLNVLGQLAELHSAVTKSTVEKAAVAHTEARRWMFFLGGFALVFGLLIAGAALFFAIGVDRAAFIETAA